VPPDNLSELALVFADPSHRPPIRAGLALIAALDLALPRQGTEEAQLTRLAWWDTEIQRFIAGTPEHPATQELLRHGLPLLQAPHWQALIRAQAQRITNPNPDAQTLGNVATAMGAGFSAIATLLGGSASVDTYQQVGGSVWLVNQLCSRPDDRNHSRLMDQAAQQLATAANQLSFTSPAINHRFAIVLAALYARTAHRESRRPGAGMPAPLSRLWWAWRAALRAR
jgi:hypothetical protein